MIMTILLTMVMMAGLFLLLYASVALIQDKKFFGSAPQEVQDVIQPKKERFMYAHHLGRRLVLIAILLMLGAVVYGGIDGARHGYSLWQYFLRFLIMLWGLEAFDILFFDYYLLCRSGFFSYYYPEVKEVLGPHLFGFNRNTHMLCILLSPVISFMIAWGCCMY